MSEVEPKFPLSREQLIRALLAGSHKLAVENGHPVTPAERKQFESDVRQQARYMLAELGIR